MIARIRSWLRLSARVLPVAVILWATGALAAPHAHADNKRLNSAVVSAVYTFQHQAGCTNDVIRDNALTLAAQWHADDMINNRNINDDTGSDGTSPQDRANAAGFHGKAAETVAINPAIASAVSNWSTSGTPTPTIWRSSATAPTPTSGCGRTTARIAPLSSPFTDSPPPHGGSPVSRRPASTACRRPLARHRHDSWWLPRLGRRRDRRPRRPPSR